MGNDIITLLQECDTLIKSPAFRNAPFASRSLGKNPKRIEH